MDVPEDKQEVRKIIPSPVENALNQIAETEAGVVFLKWLAYRCFYDRSTVVGNPTSYEVNTIGTISQEFLRRLYLDIRHQIKPELRKRLN